MSQWVDGYEYARKQLLEEIPYYEWFVAASNLQRMSTHAPINPFYFDSSDMEPLRLLLEWMMKHRPHKTIVAVMKGEPLEY
jgi:hypothetical protein